MRLFGAEAREAILTEQLKEELNMFKDISQGIAIILGLIALGVLAVWELFGEIIRLVRRRSI